MNRAYGLEAAEAFSPPIEVVEPPIVRARQVGIPYKDTIGYLAESSTDYDVLYWDDETAVTNDDGTVVSLYD